MSIFMRMGQGYAFSELLGASWSGKIEAIRTRQSPYRDSPRIRRPIRWREWPVRTVKAKVWASSCLMFTKFTKKCCCGDRKIHEDPWRSMKIHEDPWRSMKIHEDPCYIVAQKMTCTSRRIFLGEHHVGTAVISAGWLQKSQCLSSSIFWSKKRVSQIPMEYPLFPDWNNTLLKSLPDFETDPNQMLQKIIQKSPESILQHAASCCRYPWYPCLCPPTMTMGILWV